jgi:hypothetical protein
MPPRKGRDGDSIWSKPPILIGVGVAVLVTAYIGWRWLTPSDIPLLTCGLTEGNYRVAKFFDQKGNLDLTVFSYT